MDASLSRTSPTFCPASWFSEEWSGTRGLAQLPWNCEAFDDNVG